MVLEDLSLLPPAEILVNWDEVNASSHDYVTFVVGNWLSDYHRVFFSALCAVLLVIFSLRW